MEQERSKLVVDAITAAAHECWGRHGMEGRLQRPVAARRPARAVDGGAPSVTSRDQEPAPDARRVHLGVDGTRGRWISVAIDDDTIVIG